MGKASRPKHPTPQKGTPPAQKVLPSQIIFALVVLGGLALTYVGLYRRAEQAGPEDLANRAPAASRPPTQSRAILPATPRTPRPATLEPARFSDPQTAAAYQVAQAIPQVLERLPCYCGCYESAGHQNNLDCFADQHGVT